MWKNYEQLKLPRSEGAATGAVAGRADSGSTWVPGVVQQLCLDFGPSGNLVRGGEEQGPM